MTQPLAIAPALPARSVTTSALVWVEIKTLWQLAWPILVGQLANVGMVVADVAMAGHASSTLPVQSMRLP